MFVCNKRLLSFCAGDAAPVRHLSLKSLLPDTNGYMTYEGSTTHPGCWETAVWLILNKPIYVTAREVSVDPLYLPSIRLNLYSSLDPLLFIVPLRSCVDRSISQASSPPPCKCYATTLILFSSSNASGKNLRYVTNCVALNAGGSSIVCVGTYIYIYIGCWKINKADPR